MNELHMQKSKLHISKIFAIIFMKGENPYGK